MNNQISSQEGYVSVSGGRVWYRIVGAGDAAPLLVLHGGSGVPHDYLEPLAALADERPVIVVQEWKRVGEYAAMRGMRHRYRQQPSNDCGESFHFFCVVWPSQQRTVPNCAAFNFEITLT